VKHKSVQSCHIGTCKPIYCHIFHMQRAMQCQISHMIVQVIHSTSNSFV